MIASAGGALAQRATVFHPLNFQGDGNENKLLGELGRCASGGKMKTARSYRAADLVLIPSFSVLTLTGRAVVAKTG